MIVAITGNIACGKTYVSNYLKGKGFNVFDCDQYAKEILLENTDKVIEVFGDDVISNGNLDKSKLSKIIFSNKEKKQILENIIHPYVKDKILKIKKNNELYFIEIAILFEVNWESLFDCIILVSCDVQTSINRCIINRGYTKDEANLRIKNQLDVKIKEKKSDYIVYNNSNFNDLKNSVDKILLSIKEKYEAFK